MTSPTSTKKMHPLIFLLVLLLSIWGILTVYIDRSWFEYRGDNGRWISTAARNYEIYGASNINYLVTISPGPTDINDLYYYVNHPPLVVWLVSIASDLFGRYGETSQFVSGTPYELSARIVSIFATMISLSAFYAIVKQLLDDRLAVFALFLYSFTPMTMFFGRMVDHEPLALAFLYLFIAIFIKWMRQYSHQRTITLIILAGLAMWSAWAPAFFLFPLGIVALVSGGKKQKIGIIAIGIAALIFTVAIFLYYGSAHDGTFATLIKAFSFRTSNSSLNPDSVAFTLPQFIARQAKHMLTMMSFSVVILGGIGIWISLRHYKALRRSIPLALIGAGLLYMLVFRNAVYEHDYYKVYFMVGMSITATLTVKWIIEMKPVGWRIYMRPLVFSIVITSLGASFWSTFGLHQIGASEFPSTVALEIRQNTEEDDLIFTNLAETLWDYSYYAYRNIATLSTEEALELAKTEDKHVWYLLCSGSDKDGLTNYAGPLSNFDSLPVAGACQLFSLDL